MTHLRWRWCSNPFSTQHLAKHKKRCRNKSTKSSCDLWLPSLGKKSDVFGSEKWSNFELVGKNRRIVDFNKVFNSPRNLQRSDLLKFGPRKNPEYLITRSQLPEFRGPFVKWILDGPFRWDAWAKLGMRSDFSNNGSSKKTIADMPPFNTTNWHPPELDVRIQVMNVKYLITLSYTERYVCQSCYSKLANNMIWFSFSVGVYFSRASQFQPLSTRSSTWPLKNDGWKTTFLLGFGNFSELLLLNLGRVVFGTRKTSWWFQPIWQILVKLDHFPRDRGEKKYLSCHHLEKDITYSKLTRPYRAKNPILAYLSPWWLDRHSSHAWKLSG